MVSSLLQNFILVVYLNNAKILVSFNSTAIFLIHTCLSKNRVTVPLKTLDNRFAKAPIKPPLRKLTSTLPILAEQDTGIN